MSSSPSTAWGGEDEVRRKQEAASRNEYAEERVETRFQSLASHWGDEEAVPKKIQTKGSLCFCFLFGRIRFFIWLFCIY